MTEALVEKGKRVERTFNAPEITRALTALAYANGNGRKASRDLAEDGFEIDHSILYRWKKEIHVEEYEKIRAEILPQIRKEAGDDHLALMRLQMEASTIATEEWLERRKELDAKELSSAARNFDVGTGIHSQNAQLFHDQPTERRAVDLGGTLKELRSLGVDPSQVIDAQVVSEEDVPGSEDGDSASSGLESGVDDSDSGSLSGRSDSSSGSSSSGLADQPHHTE